MEEEIVDAELESKQQKMDEQQETSHAEQSTSSSSKKVALPKAAPVLSKKVASNESWNKSVGSLRKKGPLVGLVKVKKPQNNGGASEEEKKPEEAVTSSHQQAEENKPASNGLSLLGAYSDSETSD